MSTVKNNNFPLRFRTKTQKNAAKRLARKTRDSLNEYILSLIDKEIELTKKMNELGKGGIPLPKDYIAVENVSLTT